MYAVFRKEILQFCRSFIFGGALFFQIIISLIALMTVVNTNADVFYSGVCGALSMLAGAVVISIAGSRWHRELGDDAMDMRFTTPLSIIQIIAGKVSATLAAAAVPVLLGFFFITIGPEQLDPVRWLISLPLCLGGMAAVAGWMLAFSTLHSNMPRYRFDISGVIAVICVVSAMCGYTALFDPSVRTMKNMELLKVWIFVFCNFTMALAVIYGAIAPGSSNRILPVRVMLIVWALVMTPLVDGGTAEIVLYLPAVGALLIASAERIKQSRRVIAAARRMPLAVRPLYLLFSSGAVNGMLFSLLALGVIAAAGRCDTGILRNYAVLFFYTAAALNIRAWREKNFHPSGGAAVLLMVTLLMSAAGVVISCSNKEIGGLLTPFHDKPETLWGYIASIGTAAAALLLLISPVRMYFASCRVVKK